MPGIPSLSAKVARPELDYFSHVVPGPADRHDVKDAPRLSVSAQVLLALVAVMVLCSGLFWIGVSIWGSDEAGSSFDIARTVVTFVGLLGATTLAVIAMRRQLSTEATHHLEVQRTELERERDERDTALAFARDEREIVRALRERYTTVAGQLGHESPAVRLAGAYAIAALADDWTEREDVSETQACIDVLCAYLRSPRPLPDEAEEQVRDAILRVVSGRLKPGGARNWSMYDFDFTGAQFSGNVDFSNAVWSGTVLFTRVRFEGEVSTFWGATFEGQVTSFKGSVFDGETSFQGAKFQGAGAVWFVEARFAGEKTLFNGAKFSGEGASFVRANFESAITSFGGAGFRATTASFDEVTFGGGEVSFVAAALGEISFDGASFSAETAAFHGANFLGDASFVDAQFLGELVLFVQCVFAARTSFQWSLFSGTRTSFNEATFKGRSLTFDDARVVGGGIFFDHAIWNGVAATFEDVRCSEDGVIEGLEDPRIGNGATIRAHGRDYSGPDQ